MEYILRQYQQDCIDSIVRCINREKNRVLVAMATGLGKTVMFAHLPLFLNFEKRWLVLAHREELLNQAYEKFKAINPRVSVGIEQGERHCEGSQIVIASVQTMQGKRLKRFHSEEFNVVICDEAHHSVAPSYRKVFEHFGVNFEGTRKCLIGVTATPNRGDEVGLSTVYDDIAYEYNLEDGIEDGFLCDIIGKKIKTDINLNGVKSRMGDFALNDLADAVDSPQRNQLIVDKWKELASERKTLAFCVNVKHAESLHKAFLESEVKSSIVTGKTPKKERSEILGAFLRGENQIICNCGVLTEGFDDPQVSCIIGARPTQSSSLYTQIIGRGTRPGKPNCLVLDFTDNCDKQSVQDLPTLFGLPPDFVVEKKIIDEKKEIEEFQIDHPWLDLTKLKSIKQLPSVSRDIQFFRVKPPQTIERFTKFQWIIIHGGYRLALSGNEALEIIPTRFNTFRIYARVGTARAFLDEKTKLGESVKQADRWVKRVRKGSVNLIDLRKTWRDEKPSKKQIALLDRLKLEYPKEINRGQAAAMITMSFEKKKINKKSH